MPSSSHSTNVCQAYYVPVPRDSIETQEQNKTGKVMALMELRDSVRIPINRKIGQKITDCDEFIPKLGLAGRKSLRI